MLVATIYLLNVLNRAFALCTQSSYQQGYTGAYIRTAHGYTTKLLFSFKSDNNRTMRITKNDLCAHVYQFIYKEKAALKHFLVNEHASLCLYGRYQHNAQQVGCKA